MSRAQAGEFSLEYFEAGDGDRVVVLVHGASSSGRIWHSVQQELARQSIRSVAISLLGAGGSDRGANTEDYHPESYARQLADLVDALGLTKFTLFGHSLGTIVAAYYVRDHAGRVDGLIQMSGPPTIGELPEQPPDEGSQVRVRNPDGPDLRARWEQQHQGLPDNVREALGRDIANNPPQRMAGQRPPWTGIDDVASNITVPTLVICGDADDVVHPQYPVRYYLSLPAEQRHLHVFHGIGHYPNAQIPARLAGVVSRFITSRLSAE